MNSKIKLLVIPPDKGGCGYFRSIQPHEYIAKNYSDEFDVDITDKTTSTNLYEFFSKYDIVHIHKQIDKDCKFADIIKQCGCKLIVDIDDYYNLGNDHPMSQMAKLHNYEQVIKNHLKKADLITTTTEIFKKDLININPNVAVLPNAINPLEAQFIPHETKSKRIRFGIICGSSHLEDIKLLSGMVSSLPKDVLNKIQIVLCGFDTNGKKMVKNIHTQQFMEIPILPTETCWYDYEKILTNNYTTISEGHKEFLLKFIKNAESPFNNEAYMRYWTKPIEEYATHYNNIDVLLVPLKENKFNKMKSQLKVIEAGFFHKAIIAQNFGPYTIDLVSMIEKGGVINPNGNSLLVDSSKNHKQWAKYICKLVENPSMITTLSENLYNTVKDKYSLEEVTKLRVNEYKKLMNV